MRDAAAGGLACLLTRPAWRDSDLGSGLRDAVTRLVTDESPLVRMRAVGACRALHTEFGPAERVAALRDYVMAESDERVLAVLLSELSRDAVSAPEEVDAVLRQFSNRPAGAFLTAQTGAVGQESLLPLLAYLAAVPQTPFAADLVAGWFRDAVVYHEKVCRLLHGLRQFLNNPDGLGQQAAFELLKSAAATARDRWKDMQGEQADGTTAPDADALAAAAEVAHGIAEQVYFASGAFDDRSGGTEEPASRGDSRRFADFAVPILQVCAEVPVPQCVHATVQTLVHLAPLSERRMLLAVAAAVPERSAYAADSLAGGVVLPYLQRLLAEQPALVLHDPDGLAAFRHLLQTFAAAGNEEALTLAYSFADVFR